MSPQEETTKKRGKSLTLTVGGSESTVEDGVTDDLAVGLKTARGEPELHLSGGIVVEAVKTEKNEKNRAAVQGTEDADLGPQEEKELPTNGVGIVLLCVSGCLNGNPVF